MALQVYFKDDIEQVVCGIVGSVLDSATSQNGLNVEYCQGSIDTAKHILQGFGINWKGALLDVGESVKDPETKTLLDEMVRLLPSVR